MREAKYSVGTKVYHETKKKWGVVERVLLSEAPDNKSSEYRYYVNHSGWTWSIPERCLSKKPGSA